MLKGKCLEVERLFYLNSQVTASGCCYQNEDVMNNTMNHIIERVEKLNEILCYDGGEYYIEVKNFDIADKIEKYIDKIRTQQKMYLSYIHPESQARDMVEEVFLLLNEELLMIEKDLGI